MDIRDDIIPIPPGQWVCPHQRGADPCDCPDCKGAVIAKLKINRLFERLYPSGAKLVIWRGPGYDVVHLEMPYHTDDIYERFLGTGEEKANGST